MEVHFIINEKSGSGNGRKVWSKLKNQLNIKFFEHITQFSGHALQLSKSISIEFLKRNEKALIVAVGGDGTIHEVINGIDPQSKLYIGFVKAGSGNDFSRTFQSFETANDIEQFLKTPSGSKMDCGQLVYFEEARKFVNNAGIGFDAFVTLKASHSKIKRLLNKIGLGKLSYGFSTIIALFTFKRFNVEVEVDGNLYNFNKAWFVTVSNQPYFGGGMKLSPDSKPNDGELEVTIVNNLTHLKLLLLFVTVFFGAHTKLTAVTQFKGKTFHVRVSDPLYFHTDGEVIGSTNASLTYQIIKENWICVDNNRKSTQIIEI
ncbi:diacylglycerol/lipid kinase family protein [Ureibacillus manganicus]|uniref:DAGKc domain-containing protein n=1 Tax=Ureibacillus manganicus DSM 26584 TaxID=1384049 RepID=A0A0A3IIN4_9BACL|nr:diacylglycerol kinase family protein [Ureibacillus manganicus]KGR74722.1 hypothetical protein CD29_18490 [Ureibacillus manganicus DSM 26584]